MPTIAVLFFISNETFFVYNECDIDIVTKMYKALSRPR